MKVRFLVALLVAAVVSTGVSAQQDRPTCVRAVAAGHKAPVIYSNFFSGRLSEAQPEADDLRDFWGVFQIG